MEQEQEVRDLEQVKAQEENEMEKEQKKYACALCGYTADGRFIGDICPECGEKCDFIDVSCYIPECGGPDHIDPHLWREKIA